jgi:hypothetical protein
MTEARALTLIFLGVLILSIAGCLALAALDANGTMYSLLAVAVGGGAAQISTAVIEHYSSERRKR